jgi:ubiquinone biosynthesis protein COQ9
MSAQSRTELLRKVVQLAPQLGWHKETVREAARQLGLPSIAHGLLADGPMDAIAFHLEQQQRAVEMEPVQGKCVFPKAEIPSNSLSSLESFKSFNITNQK